MNTIVTILLVKSYKEASSHTTSQLTKLEEVASPILFLPGFC